MTRTDLLSNPMTTAEDLIVGGSSGVPARLPKGDDDDVLTVVAGAVIWQPPAAGLAFSQTRIYRATSQTITGSGTQTVISWSDEIVDIDGLWAIGDPTKLIIPSALNGRKGVVYCRVAMSGSSSGTFRRLRLLKAGSEAATVTQGVSGTTAPHLQVRSDVETLATSDEWTAAFNADVAGLTITGGATINQFGFYTVD